MTLKLNIGAGDTVIDGFTPIDRKFGTEAYPLNYPDNSVDEIRASHILEHFTFADAQEAMAEWVRVLKPGGKIRVAVPDVDKVLADKSEHRLFFLMGGQTDENDVHKSAYDRDRLTRLMHQNGLRGIKDWYSPNTDTAALAISLNLEGYKAGDVATAKPQQQVPPEATEQPGPTPTTATVKIGAYLTLPRYEAVCARSVIEQALKPLQIDLTTSQGVFWGQCMQRMFENAVEKGLDWILSIDSDSLFSSEQLSLLLDTFAQTPDADAMAALQCRRGSPYPLMTTGKGIDNEVIKVDGRPIKVTTAHFGLTLIRVDALRTLPKPWFASQPDDNGEWGDGRLDDDIWFWHQWRRNGKKIYVAPGVSIGHLEEVVACFDENLKPKHIYVHQWREQNLKHLKPPKLS